MDEKKFKSLLDDPLDLYDLSTDEIHSFVVSTYHDKDGTHTLEWSNQVRGYADVLHSRRIVKVIAASKGLIEKDPPI